MAESRPRGERRKPAVAKPPPGRKITVEVWRSSPAEGVEPHWERFADVPLDEGMSVTNVLFRLNELSARGVAYRVSCHRGICASCIMRVNGKTRLGCSETVDGDLKLEPAFADKVVKDLVVEQR
jgi:succinate dehydrogenase / fumarate reductase iron-sulfur subunit